MPTPQQMTGMRARYKARLPRTCTVPGLPRASAVQGAASGVGGTVQESFGTPVTGVRCSFHALGGGERPVQGSLTELISHEVRFEWGAQLKTGMEIVVDADPVLVDGTHRFRLVSPSPQPFMVGRKWMAKEL